MDLLRTTRIPLKHIIIQPCSVDDSHMMLSYINSDDAQKQFGSIVLELDPTARKLEGDFLGYGPVSKSLVTGKVEAILK